MSRLVRVALAASLALCAMSTAAFAAASTLQLIIGGEAYDGPPKFEVTFDGKALGEGAVDAAIDTASDGRFADAADRTAYVQSFDFAIPEDVFKPGGEVRVRLVNEAYGGDGSNRDRNLYLAAVAVNGRAVTVSGLTTLGSKPDIENELIGEFLVLHDGNVEGVSKAPSGGWPEPGAEIAAAHAAPAKDPAAEPAKAPVVMASLKVPEGSAAGTDEIKTASIQQPAGAAPTTSCNRDELYNVVGFNESSNDLTPRLMERLNEIIADIGAQKCKVQITGYSSKQGAFAMNALFAIERAQNVLTYLRQNGLSFDSVNAAGGGATEQFGEQPSDNRRVVIAVTP